MESLNLVKVDLKIKYNTIFNSKDNTKKILIFLFVLILAIIPIEFSIIKNYYILKNINMESIILIAILNIESLLIFITTFIGVSNNFFLEHNVSTLLFYPIKSRSILFSKSILEYLKGFAIGLIGFVFFYNLWDFKQLFNLLLFKSAYFTTNNPNNMCYLYI